jgi:ribosome recycling factor
MDLISSTSQNMQKVLSVLQQDLATVRTGRAAPSLVDHLEVVVYGGSAKMKIMELATVTATDAQTLTIAPFDSSILGEIQKGILEANIGFTPSNDGQVIRISIPPLSEERRKELIKLMHQKLENGKVMIRQVRQDAMVDLKKDETLSEDDLRRLEKEVQKVTDEFMGKIEILGKQKEAELMQI